MLKKEKNKKEQTIHSYSNEVIYVGEIKDGCRHGVGKVYYPNGMVFEGNFYKGKKQGLGIMFTPNGKYQKRFYIGGHKVFIWPARDIKEGQREVDDVYAHQAELIDLYNKAPSLSQSELDRDIKALNVELSKAFDVKDENVDDENIEEQLLNAFSDIKEEELEK